MNASKTPRWLSIDALRGLIMVLMALDHANHFVAQKHPPGEHWGGSFPIYQDGISFITRLVTHLAAPGFFFLMGMGMYFFARSRREGGWSEWEIIRHFLVRGSILIFLQLTIINQAWKLGPGVFPDNYIGVLFALGGTMIIASLLLQLKPINWLILSGVLLIGTELLHPDPSQWGLSNPLGLLTLYSGGSLEFWSNYPILTWLELVVFGLAFGCWLVADSAVAYKRALWLGLSFLVGFFLIRYLDGFGNIRPRAGEDWMDYLNVVKYPPSMAFSLMTMGLNLIILAGFSWVADRWSRLLESLAVFGRVPLFFYVLHLYLYLILGSWLTPKGTNILVTYPYWVLGLVILYPLCQRYGRMKQGQSGDSVFRFL